MNYLKLYNRLIISRKLFPSVEKHMHRHHILPKSMGGDNSDENIVYLTEREHYLAHCMLVFHFRQVGDKRNELKNVRSVNVMVLGKPILKKLKINSRLFKICRQMWYDRIEKRITYKNETHTIREWSNILNLPYQSFRSRFYHCSSKEQIFIPQLITGKTTEQKAKTTVSLFGLEMTLDEISREYNIPVNDLYKRYQRNGKLEGHLQPHRTCKKYFIGGVEMSLRQVSDMIKIDYEYLRNLIYTKRISLEEILKDTQRYKNNWHKVHYNGQNLSIIQVAKKLGVHRNVLYSYTSRGCSIYEAIQKIQNGEYKKRIIKRFNIDGQSMTMKEISQKFQISYSSLRVYMSKNKYDIKYVLTRFFGYHIKSLSKSQEKNIDSNTNI